MITVKNEWCTVYLKAQVCNQRAGSFRKCQEAGFDDW